MVDKKNDKSDEMKLIDSNFARKVTNSRDWFSCHGKESAHWYLLFNDNDKYIW